MKPIFTRKSGIQISKGYTRVVHGGRGNYIEISSQDIILSNLFIPENQEWRLKSEKCYYLWYSTKDGVKVYLQRKTVNYADYIVGYYYVSPLDCKDFKFGLEKWV